MIRKIGEKTISASIEQMKSHILFRTLSRPSKGELVYAHQTNGQMRSGSAIRSSKK